MNEATEVMESVAEQLTREDRFSALLAERDNLNQVAEVRMKEIAHLNKVIEELKSSAEATEARFKAFSDSLGVTHLIERIAALELRLDKLNFDDKRSFVEDTISNWMGDNFEVTDYFDSVYDWSRYIDYVSEDDLTDKVRDAVRELTFTVEVS